MDIVTSTPLNELKSEVNPYKLKVKLPCHLNQELFRNDSVENKKQENNNWDAINGPCFAELQSDMSGPHDSYFDNCQSDDGTPLSIKVNPLLPLAENEIIKSLKNWSISNIEENGSMEETTLKAEECLEAALENPNSMAMPTNNLSIDKSTERRRATIVRPFSFELREKLKKEHKEEKIKYQIACEKSRTNQIEAKFSPKSAEKPKSKPIIIKRDDKLTIKSSPSTSGESKDSGTEMQMDIDINTKVPEQVKNIPQNSNCQIEPWKKKPFKPVFLKKPLTVAKSPKLLTAQRALSRKLLEERLMEKEKQEIELRKKQLATKRQLDRKESAGMNPYLAKRRRKN